MLKRRINHPKKPTYALIFFLMILFFGFNPCAFALNVKGLWYFSVGCNQREDSPYYNVMCPCPESFNFNIVLGDVDHDDLPETVFLRCHKVNVVKDVGFDGGLANIIWEYPVDIDTDIGIFPRYIPAIADMDNDGLQEIVVADGNGRILVLKPFLENGLLNPQPLLWSSPVLPEWSTHQFSIGDMNNDGFPDIVVINWPRDSTEVYVIGGQEHILIWKHTEREIIDTQQIGTGDFPTLADVNRDGTLDVIFGIDTRVIVLNADPDNPGRGKVIMSWTAPGALFNSNIPVVCDINHDGKMEIILSYKGKVTALTAQGNRLVEIWKPVTIHPEGPYSDFIHDFVLGDIDNDGENIEVVVRSEERDKIYILSSRGELLWESSHIPSRFYNSEPALADMDFDGDLEIAVLTENTLEIYDPVFSPARNPDPVYRRELESSMSTGLNNYPVIGDTNGDDLLEVIIAYDNFKYERDPARKLVWWNAGDIRSLSLLDSGEKEEKVIWGAYNADNYRNGLGEHGRLSEVPIPSFCRGDVNADGKIDLNDVILLLNLLFSNKAVISREAADVNGDGRLMLGDAIYLLAYLFSGGPQPPAPFCAK